MLEVICQRVSAFTLLRCRTRINETEQQAVFDVLHGKPVVTIRGVLTEFIERHASIMDNGERIPAYQPIAFNAHSPARILVTLQAHGPSTMPISFAAFLDGEGLDVVAVVVPVLAQTGLAPQSEPLPWD